MSIINHDFFCNKTMKHSSNANIKQFANYLTSTPHKFVPVLALEPFSLWTQTQVNWTAKTICVAIKSAIYEWHMDRTSNNKRSVKPRRTGPWQTPPPVCSPMSCLLHRIKHNLHCTCKYMHFLPPFLTYSKFQNRILSSSFIIEPPLTRSFERL